MPITEVVEQTQHPVNTARELKAPLRTIGLYTHDEQDSEGDNDSSDRNSLERPKCSTLFAIIRKAMKAKERAKPVLDSLKYLQVLKLDNRIKPNKETGGYDGIDFRIVPEMEHILEVKTGAGENEVAFYPFRQFAELARETRRVAKEISKNNKLKVTVKGLSSIEIVTDNAEVYRIIGKKIYLDKRKRLIEVKDKTQNIAQTLLQCLRVPVACPCGKSHYLWGMEIEFDAYGYSKLTSETLDRYSIPFQPIGRDGAGQGEVRGIPDNYFKRTAQSAISNYRQALGIVAQSKNEFATVSGLVQKLQDEVEKCQNVCLNKNSMEEITKLNSDSEKAPNGIHIHGPRSEYVELATKVIAIWWNQRTKNAKAMLQRRLKHDYGCLASVRKSQVCGRGYYTEFRQLNSDTPDNIETLLLPVLANIVEHNPKLPDLPLKYSDPEAFQIAEYFCLSLLGREMGSKTEIAASCEEAYHV